MTPMQAATKFKEMLVKKYGESETTELVIWDKAKSAEMGFGEGEATICWEGGPCEWAVTESMTEFAFSLKGILAEPYNHFVLNFYQT